jgi:hypothetical protein
MMKIVQCNDSYNQASTEKGGRAYVYMSRCSIMQLYLLSLHVNHHLLTDDIEALPISFLRFPPNKPVLGSHDVAEDYAIFRQLSHTALVFLFPLQSPIWLPAVSLYHQSRE